jgi:hypothetical protein
LANFPTQEYTPLSTVLQPTLYVPPLQQLLKRILDQTTQPTRAALSGPLVFNMMEDLSQTDINAEQVEMNMEPSIADRAVEAGGDHPPLMDYEEHTLEVDVVVLDTDGEDNKVLPSENWQGIMEKDYNEILQTFPC